MSYKTSIYLVRHGIAAEKGTYPYDGERPLIKEGRQQTKKVAKKLGELGLSFDLILTSPLIRAKETAEILKKAGLGNQITESPDLAPMGNFSNWLHWVTDWHKSSSGQSLALVGHQPDLGNWAERLVWGSVRDNIDLKKSGIIGINFPETEHIVGDCSLFWLTSPKYLL
ncbi:phosphohistidine phosphatase SixA [Merismopedia glauca]|uniref:Phosphohistidine phosphatase SixA n=1 Tax=Merismopedia glauca CCAP 1448/3 TaxID=1296344 RepID=A0A2T1CA68_9CYAN|nr:phosphohistidine phosphatase SixA [Merismopedia glauca]PSB05156.1 phosphohistidine phosphatase SixA [Merismopedia glauca CCAP 1448/3]